MCLRLALTLALAVLCLAFAPAPFPRKERREAAAAPSMEGFWQGPNWIQVTATHVTFHKARAPSYSLAVDRAARPPTYDLLDVGGRRVQFQGIYRVEGDTLTMCYNPATSGRPTAFEGPGKGQFVEVYQRVR